MVTGFHLKIQADLIPLTISFCISNGMTNNSLGSKNYETAENQEINEKANNDYYQSAFSEKALIYSESENSDQLFTDVENYRTTKNDSIQENYGPI